MKIKEKMLGVHTTQNYCVSSECAQEMAKGVTECFGSDIGISTTGFAENFENNNKQICYYCIYDSTNKKYYISNSFLMIYIIFFF